LSVPGLRLLRRQQAAPELPAARQRPDPPPRRRRLVNVTVYLIRRVAQAGLVVVGIAFVVFAIVRLTGDPARTMLPQEASAAEVAAFREAMGFNRPMPVQFVDFVSRAVRGDFGRSLHYNQ